VAAENTLEIIVRDDGGTPAGPPPAPGPASQAPTPGPKFAPPTGSGVLHAPEDDPAERFGTRPPLGPPQPRPAPPGDLRPNPDLDEAFGQSSKGPPQPRPNPPADPRHNPALDELFGGRPTGSGVPNAPPDGPAKPPVEKDEIGAAKDLARSFRAEMAELARVARLFGFPQVSAGINAYGAMRGPPQASGGGSGGTGGGGKGPGSFLGDLLGGTGGKGGGGAGGGAGAAAGAGEVAGAEAAGGAAAGLAGIAAVAGPVALALLGVKLINDQIGKAGDEFRKDLVRMGEATKAIVRDDPLKVLTIGSEKVAESLEKTGVGGKLAAEALRTLTAGANVLNDVITAVADRGKSLQGYDARIAGAASEQQVAGILNDIREAQTLGDDYSRLIKAQTSVESDLRDLLLPIKQFVVEKLAAFMEFVSDAIRSVKEAVEDIRSVIKAIHTIVNAILEALQKFMTGDVAGAMAVMAKAAVDISSTMKDREKREAQRGAGTAMEQLLGLADGPGFKSVRGAGQPNPGGALNVPIVGGW
jgi:hypothetical protein